MSRQAAYNVVVLTFTPSAVSGGIIYNVMAQIGQGAVSQNLCTGHIVDIIVHAFNTRHIILAKL